MIQGLDKLLDMSIATLDETNSYLSESSQKVGITAQI